MAQTRSMPKPKNYDESSLATSKALLAVPAERTKTVLPVADPLRREEAQTFNLRPPFELPLLTNS